MEIVKIQSSLMSRKDGKALVYPKASAEAAAMGDISSKSRVTQQRLDDKTKKLMGGRAQAYFKAVWDGKRWRPVRTLPDQGW